MLIEVRQASFGYSGRPVVRIDYLALRAGLCLGIFGPNGSGKTTLVRGMVGLLKPLQGEVIRADNVRFGYLPQHRHLDLAWPMTALDAASMAISARRRFGWVGKDRRVVLDMMRRLRVDNLASRSFAKLSGGQQQRILLAGAMASEPQLLVLDEPTEGLDVHSRQLLLELLREFGAAGLATVIISHEVEDLMFLCDQVARLHPADEPGEPSHVELTTPSGLAEQLLVSPAARQGGGDA